MPTKARFDDPSQCPCIGVADFAHLSHIETNGRLEWERRPFPEKLPHPRFEDSEWTLHGEVEAITPPFDMVARKEALDSLPGFAQHGSRAFAKGPHGQNQTIGQGEGARIARKGEDAGRGTIGFAALRAWRPKDDGLHCSCSQFHGSMLQSGRAEAQAGAAALVGFIS